MKKFRKEKEKLESSDAIKKAREKFVSFLFSALTEYFEYCTSKYRHDSVEAIFKYM